MTESARLPLREPPESQDRVYRCQQCGILVAFLRGAEPQKGQIILCPRCSDDDEDYPLSRSDA